MADRGLAVLVADLLHRPGARRHISERWTADSLKVVGSTIVRGTEVGVEGTLEWVSEGLLATGSATAPYQGECRRCLTTVDGTVHAQFQELFEFEAREGESYPIKGEHIDLAPLSREALLLSLPLAPLCRENCAGLCPRCGADLNAGPCGCEPDDRDPRWAALDVLKTDAEDE